MIAIVAQFVVAAALIVAAGIFLTHYGDAIAELTGLGRLLVGSVLIAGATSLPELTVDLSAIHYGWADLALGDLFGSSLINLAILAMVDLTHLSRGQMLSRTAAAHALSGLLSMGMLSIVTLFVVLGSKAETWTLFDVGAGPWLALLAYCFGVRLVYLDQQIAAQEAAAKAEAEPAKEEKPAEPISLQHAVIGFVAASAVILVSGPFLSESAGKLAEMTGLGTTFLGTTLVAFCTSLPELVATIAAVRMGAFDMAVGNIFGSNAFNMILLVPLDLLHPGSLLASASPTHAITALFVITITVVAVIGQLYRVEHRILFVEPDALTILILVAAALAAVFFLR